MAIVYILIVLFFLYFLFGFLIRFALKEKLSRHRCECKKRAIRWKVPFYPGWIFSLSEEMHLEYFGKCESCGNMHKAVLEHEGITFSTAHIDKPASNAMIRNSFKASKIP